MVSCIIPAYNVGSSLDRGLRTLLQQTYDNLEVIIIDDGSTDDTASVADTWSAENSSIRVYHTENHGVSCARNLGMEKASGQYFLFFDADDSLDPVAINACVGMLRHDSSDVVFFNYREENASTGELQNLAYPNFPDMQTVSSTVAMEWMLTWRFAWSACMMVVKSQIIRQNELAFPKNIGVAEDLAFTSHLLASASKISFIPKTFYYYQRRPDSAMGMRYGDESRALKTVSDVISVEQNLKNLVYASFPALSGSYSCHLVHFVYSNVFIPLFRSACSKKEKRKLAKQVYSTLLYNCNIGDLQFKDKIKLFLMRIQL